MDFEGAWILDENGQRRLFHKGEAKAPGYERHNLVCES